MAMSFTEVVQQSGEVLAQHRAAARLARVVPYDFDNEEKLYPMALLEEVTHISIARPRLRRV